MENMVSEDAILAVKRGIHWLDENHPDWATRIDLSELDMAECRSCVIGQAVGDYSETINKQAGVAWSVNHGFESPKVGVYQVSDGSIPPDYGYSTLDTLWTDEVKKRLG